MSTTPGKGTLTYPDGSKLVGEFEGDQANGDGVLHFKNGDTYEGPFKVGLWTCGEIFSPQGAGRGRVLFVCGVGGGLGWWMCLMSGRVGIGMGR